MGKKWPATARRGRTSTKSAGARGGDEPEDGQVREPIPLRSLFIPANGIVAPSASARHVASRNHSRTTLRLQILCAVIIATEDPRALAGDEACTLASRKRCGKFA